MPSEEVIMSLNYKTIDMIEDIQQATGGTKAYAIGVSVKVFHNFYKSLARDGFVFIEDARGNRIRISAFNPNADKYK